MYLPQLLLPRMVVIISRNNNMFKQFNLISSSLLMLCWSPLIAADIVDLSSGVSNEQSSIFRVGGTYDSMSLHPTTVSSCLKAAANPEYLNISNPKASLDFSQAQSLDSVQRALGVEFSARFGYGPFTVNTSYNYAQSSQDDNYTLNLNYIYQYAGKAGFKDAAPIFGTAALTPTALGVLNSPTDFRKMCGNRVIVKLDAGVSLLIRMSLSFDSLVEKTFYSDSFSQIGGLQNILAAIKSNPNNLHFKLTASGIQVGGDPQLLQQLFIQNGGSISQDGYPVLDCGNENSDHSSCVNLINQVISYAQELSQQLNRSSDFYLNNPSTLNWAEIGIAAPQIMQDPKVAQALQQLTKQYYQDVQDLKFILNYRNMLASKSLLSAAMQQDLDKLTVNYQRVIDLYLEPRLKIMECFNGFVDNSCLIIRDNLFKLRSSILAESRLKQLLSYLKTNQYLAALVVSPSLDNYVQCMLSPISVSERHLYLLNCNGQASGTLNLSTGISLIRSADGHSLVVNNLNYNHYDQFYINYLFTYQFNQALQQDSFYPNVFGGLAYVSNPDNGTAIMQNVMFIKIYY